MLKKGIQKRHTYKSTVLIAGIAVLFASAFLIGIAAIQSIRSSVRTTTIQIIREITNTKSQMLTAILEEAELDLLSLADSLSVTKDDPGVTSLLERFEENHPLDGLTILYEDSHVLYGAGDANLLKGIPARIMQQVKADGFVRSGPLIGKNGDRRILFGTVLDEKRFLYASLPTDFIQKACGETTYLGEGYSYILGQDGKIVVSPVRYNYEQVYENIRNLLTYADNPPEKIESFIQALNAGDTGSVVFHIDNQEQLFCFEPVHGEQDWQLVTVIALSAVEKNGTKIIQTAMVMAAVIIGVVVATLAAGSFFYWSMQRRQQENDRFLLNIYQAISKNTDTVIFILNNKSPTPDYVFENSGRLLGIPAEEFLENQESGEPSGTFKNRLQALLEEPWPAEGCRQEINAYNDRLHCDMWLKVLVCPFQLGKDPKCIYAITDVTQEHHDQEKIAASVVAAEQANAAKSNFFSSMSHDMRTPMNGIVGMTAIAKRSLDNRDRVLDCLDKIDLSSRHLLSLINDVLDMSKIESGKLALVSEPFYLDEVLHGLETILRPQCESKKQVLSFNLDIKHPRLSGDTLRLNQIFMNLLSNAIKFTPEGGRITFTAEERERRADTAMFRFTVTDNGIGISPEVQEIIFTPFERVSNSEVHQIEGSGLGLAITKNLISAMGGQISLKSDVGQGSTFIVDLNLPLQETETSTPSAPEEIILDETAFADWHFLLAEDNAINQEIAVELLGAYGARIDTAENGKQAFERFAASPPGYYNAVLMDIQMPLMNGYEATRKIRTCGHPQAKSILIIAMTANVFAEDILAAKNAGMDAHIAKPLDLVHLYQVLKEKEHPD